MSNKENSKPEMSRFRKVLFGVTVGVMVLFVSWIAVYIYANQMVIACDNDLVGINKKINQTGQISTEDPLFIKLGTDGCADLSKTPKGFIRQEIVP